MLIFEVDNNTMNIYAESSVNDELSLANFVATYKMDTAYPQVLIKTYLGNQEILKNDEYKTILSQDMIELFSLVYSQIQADS